jgi:GDPmannose 4,6-dehydratase
MAKRALITGVTGQDGAYLSKLLLEKGYEVYGTLRRTSDLSLSRHKHLGIEDSIRFVPMDLLEYTNIKNIIQKVRPEEVYNFGAQSFVALSFEQPVFTTDVTGTGALRVLEAVREVDTGIKFYQASSSEMFGKVTESPQNEKTPFHPRSPYAAAKAFAHAMAVNYRESYGMFICSGILFNHESPLRGLEFVTRKITNSVAKIKHGLQEDLKLGNLDACRDWGYAPEYVEAIWLMLQQMEPDDYVIATGESHSVRDFADAALGAAGIDIEWSGSGTEERGIDKKSGRTLVSVDPDFFRPADVLDLKGDYSKANKKFGWSPKTTFKELVRVMVEHDIKVVRKLKEE